MDPVPISMAHFLAGNITAAASKAANLFAASSGSSLLAVSSVKTTSLIIAIIILVLLSAFFSAMEMGYSSLNRIRLKSMETDGSVPAKKVLKQLENYNRLLNTALIGNNIVNIVATTLATLLFADLIANQAASAAVSTAVTTFAILMFAEIMPKTLAKSNPERFAMRFYPVVGLIMTLLLPLVLLFDLWRRIYRPKKSVTVTEGELLTIVEEAEIDGEINRHESELIRSAIEFDDVEICDIMVPRVYMVAVHDTDEISKIADLFADTGFSRLPVYHENIDSIVGILHEKDFFALLRERKTDIMTQVKSSICLSRNMKISDALRTLQKAKVHMAIVVDEFGGTSGLVTMEDILEELVGEIYDEHDEVEELLRREDERTFVVSGEQNLEDMFEELNIECREEFESTSVGGWVTEVLKRIPLVGESFEFKRLLITVTRANTRRVLEVKVEMPEDTDAD